MNELFLEWPIGWMSLIVLVAMVIASEAGWLLSKRLSRRASSGEEGDEFSLTAVLGLLALLIGFTFSLSLQRYDERRTLVVKEANAIGTTWLRMDLLDPEPRDNLRALLKQYVGLRVQYGLADTAKAEQEAAATSEKVQLEIWKQTSEAVYPHRTTALAQLLVSTTNDMIDVAGERAASRSSHVPARLMWALLLYCIVAAGLTGYQRGRYRVASLLVFVLVVLSLSIIVDLDRPSNGGIRVSQQPLVELLHSMD
ncbi:hypothetical protein [Dyella sp. ASV21]|jgi:hypothetical protein|uniref:bestrophin-like domain n=1 Tax=Dyella sp. ASV21 TaxID=2795114 RepID=UPI0018EDDFDE|nr:hypothetical protein [Dyella sp. ASV21]